MGAFAKVYIVIITQREQNVNTFDNTLANSFVNILLILFIELMKRACKSKRLRLLSCVLRYVML